MTVMREDDHESVRFSDSKNEEVEEEQTDHDFGDETDNKAVEPVEDVWHRSDATSHLPLAHTHKYHTHQFACSHINFARKLARTRKNLAREFAHTCISLTCEFRYVQLGTVIVVNTKSVTNWV